MRKALIVGVDYYAHFRCLFGCVNDARQVKDVLARHGDGSVNFAVKTITGSGPDAPATRTALKQAVQELFHGDSDIALFYFSGHGHVEQAGGYLIASDALRADEGLPLSELMAIANRSQAKNKIIVLDSCHSGAAGNLDVAHGSAVLSEGLTILTAAEADRYAVERNGSGVFTGLFVDALRGPAANLVGEITPGSVYAHIDQSLGPWDQRPLFKTNVKRFVSLRRVEPPISHEDLRRIVEFFPRQGHVFTLDPSFEPERSGGIADSVPPPNPRNTATFAILQKYNRVGLLVPVGAPHMWHAAMESKGCRLTVLGEHYRRLVQRGDIL